MDYNNTEKYDTDVRGDMYEYLLNRISVSGRTANLGRRDMLFVQ